MTDSWTNGQLAAAYAGAAAAIGLAEDDETMGVTYHGPNDERPWVAWVHGPEHRPASGAEGWGPSPIAAIEALVQHVRQDLKQGHREGDADR